MDLLRPFRSANGMPGIKGQTAAVFTVAPASSTDSQAPKLNKSLAFGGLGFLPPVLVRPATGFRYYGQASPLRQTVLIKACSDPAGSCSTVAGSQEVIKP
jgi:hypothetical protein